jgi:tetratricopeptide (TPR) repeat protein
MACLMQLAALDYSYRRYPDALEKYGVLFRYYTAHAVPSMQALALLGTGDTLRGAGRPHEAKTRLQQGIAIALADRALPVLLNSLLSITALCTELGQHAEAESYADSGIQVAGAVLQPFAYADLHEARGDAQLAQGRLRDALGSYDRCAELCELYGYCHRWTSVLERKRKLYEEARLPRERRDVERELLRVRALEHGAGAHDHGAHP